MREGPERGPAHHVRPSGSLHPAAYLRNPAHLRDKPVSVGGQQQSEPAPDPLVAHSQGRGRSGRLRLQMLLNAQEQKNRVPEGPLRKR